MEREEKEEWKKCRIGLCRNKVRPWEFLCDSCWDEQHEQELEDFEKELLIEQEREEWLRLERRREKNGSN
jgi:NifB/MoaA-like Fe-S oxidoreductase